MNLCHYSDFVLDPTGQLTWMSKKRVWLLTGRVILSSCLLNSFKAEVTVGGAFTLDASIFTPVVHLMRSLHKLLPRCLFSPIFQSCSFQVTEHHVRILSTANQPVYSYTVGHFSKQTVWWCVLPEVLCTVKISLHQCLSESSQKGLVMLQMSTSGYWLNNAQNQVLVFSSSIKQS